MMRSAKKRQLEYDDDNIAAKAPRLDLSHRFSSLPTFPPFAHRSMPSLNQTVGEENAVDPFFNKTKPAINDWTRLKDTRKLVQGVDSQAENILQTSPFTYQPLKEYKKAEALRLFFVKHGLDYKRPHPNIPLFSEESLSHYVEQWEDCFNHWYPIMGAEPSEAMLKRRSSTLTASSFQYRSFGKSWEGELGQEWEPSNQSIGEEFATNHQILDGFSFPSGSIFSQKPPFQPESALWSNPESVHEKVRQMVQSEVQRLLDNPGFRISQSPNSHRDDDGQGLDSENATVVAPDEDVPQ